MMRVFHFFKPPLWMLFALLLVNIPLTANAQSTCSLPLRLTIGSRGQVLGTSPNNLRAAPARSADLIGMIDGGGLFTILAGAECDPNSGIHWWQVEYNGQIGWTAEGADGAYFVEPVNPALLYRVDELVTGAGEEGRADLALYDVVTGENRILTTDILSSVTAEWSTRLGMFTWTPAGDKVAFTVEIYEPFIQTIDQSVYMMNADGSGKCLLVENAVVVNMGVFAIRSAEPTAVEGSPLDFPPCENPPAFVDAGWRFTVEPVSLGVAVNETTGERIQLTDRTLGDALYGSQLSPDQTQVALVLSDKNYNYSLYLSALVNPEPQLVTLNAEPTTSLSWSPDSQSLVIATKNDASGVVSLVRLGVTTGEQSVIYESTNIGFGLNSPAWSPSGLQIAFSNDSGAGEPHLFLINADGSDLRLLDTPVSHGWILWRPE